MSQPVDFTFERAKRDFLALTVSSREGFIRSSPSKLLTDFLAVHKISWEALVLVGGMPKELLHELNSRMEELFAKISVERERLLGVYGVGDEGELSPSQKMFYSKALAAFTVREDHYP